MHDDQTSPPQGHAIWLGAIGDSIQQRVGINCRGKTLEDALHNLSKRSGVSFEDCLKKLAFNKNDPLWDLFNKDITIPETFFFRVEDHWNALRNAVLPRLRLSGRPLSIWSAACATGEEPYTIAMTLERCGVAGTIYATDLVEDYLTHARNGCYSKRTLRGREDEEFKDYVAISSDTFTINPSIKQRVVFSQLNLLDSNAIAQHVRAHGPFDIIFCRNVLIYFTPAICASLVEQYTKALQPDGYLFLGTAEFPALWTDVVVSEQHGQAYLWRPKKSGERSVSKSAVSKTSATKTTPQKIASKTVTPTKIIELDSQSGTSLQQVLAILHTPGAYHEKVLSTVRTFVNNNELDPKSYLVLGLAYELVGKNEEALSAYAKAVFLDKSCSFSHWRQAVLYATKSEPSKALKEARWAKESIEAPKTVPFCPPGMTKTELQQAINETLQWLTT